MVQDMATTISVLFIFKLLKENLYLQEGLIFMDSAGTHHKKLMRFLYWLEVNYTSIYYYFYQWNLQVLFSNVVDTDEHNYDF